MLHVEEYLDTEPINIHMRGDYNSTGKYLNLIWGWTNRLVPIVFAIWMFLSSSHACGILNYCIVNNCLYI